MEYKKLLTIALILISGNLYSQNLIGFNAKSIPGKGLFTFYRAQDYVNSGATWSRIIPYGSTADPTLFTASTTSAATSPNVTASGAINMLPNSYLAGTQLGAFYGAVTSLKWAGTTVAVSIQPKSWSDVANYLYTLMEGSDAIINLLFTTDRKVVIGFRRVNTDTATYVYSPTAYTALNKIGIVATADFTTGIATLYVDGVAVSSGTVTIGKMDGLYRVAYIGNPNGYTMDGYYRAWLVYERCLTPQEAIRLSLYLQSLL